MPTIQVEYDSVSEVLETYYSTRSLITRIRQKSVDLRHVVQTALERNRKKYDLQLRQLKDTENREKFKVYGELINTYGYNLEEGAKTLECLNYYTSEMVSIPMDPLKTPQENSQRILQNITSKNVLLKHFLFFAKRHWTRSLIWNPFRRHLILH
mgnify:CR=1 FL=1